MNRLHLQNFVKVSKNNKKDGCNKPFFYSIRLTINSNKYIIIFMQILSDNNMRIKTYSKLKQKKYRQKMSLYVLEGLRSCSDALKDKIPIETTFCTKKELFEWAKSLNFPNIGSSISKSNL